MAITYRSGNTATGVTTVVITKPSGAVAGDVLWAEIISGDGVISAPTGWVQQASGTTPTAVASVKAFSRVMDGGANDGATYTFTCAGATVVGEGIMDAYIGVDNTTPMDTAATVATGTAATITWPNITTATDNAWHLATFGDWGVSSTPPTPSGYNGRSTTGDERNSDKAITPAGLVTGVTTTGGVDWVAISGALRPAGAGGPAGIGSANIAQSAGRFIGWTV